MANILPYNRQKALKRNYHFRVVIMVMSVFTVVMILGMSALTPAFLSAQTQQNEAKLNLALAEKVRDTAQESDSAAAIQRMSTEVSDILATDTPGIKEATDEVLYEWVFFANTIALTSISVEEATEVIKKVATTHTAMRISGVAHDRTALNAFVQSLRKNEHFTEVAFPVSSLVDTTNSTFSITFRYTP